MFPKGRRMCEKESTCFAKFKSTIIVVWRSQTHIERRARGGSATWPYQICSGGIWKWWVPHLLYTWMSTWLLNLALERVADTLRNFYLWLRRAIPCILLSVIDRRNIYAAEQNLVRPCHGPIHSVAVR